MAIQRSVAFALLAVSLLSSARCSGESKEDLVRGVLKGYRGSYVIVVSKKAFTLEIFDRDIRSIAAYRIGFGKNPDMETKLHEGDNRTPAGIYSVVEILSMDSDRKTGSYGKLAALNRVFFRASEGHSRFGKEGVDLGDNAYGPRFFLLNYPNEADRERYRKAVSDGTIQKVKGKVPGIGGGIAIHGNNDEPSIGNLSSSGCVRMYNSDIIELDQYVQVGTPVIIIRE